MRTVFRVSLALLIALAYSPAAFAQSGERLSLNAAVGPSFGNIGTTFSTMAGLDVQLNDRIALVGELGVTPHAAFRDAAEIAAPVSIDGAQAARVDAYHVNGNLKVRPFEIGGLEPYVTGGLGSLTADTVVRNAVVGASTIEDRRRITDFATNVGAGVLYRLSDWAGINADYRTFFVHRDDDMPKVHRFTTGVTFSLK